MYLVKCQAFPISLITCLWPREGKPGDVTIGTQMPKQFLQIAHGSLSTFKTLINLGCV